MLNKTSEEFKRKDREMRGNYIDMLSLANYRYDKIQTEVLTSHKKNIKIDLTWQDL